MWIAEQRTRDKVRVPNEHKGYPTDMCDQEWKLPEPLLLGVARTSA
jgi:putative transposase